MFKQRVITGLALVALILVLLFLTPPAVFNAVIVLVFGLAAWEWANLAGFSSQLPRCIYAVFMVVTILLIQFFAKMGSPLQHAEIINTILVLGAIWWVIAASLVISYPSSAGMWKSKMVRLIVGFFVLVPASIALIHITRMPQGSWIFLYTVAIVVMADVGAYVFGRWLGNRKLAVHVSPGKSWAGFWGGFACALLMAAVVGQFYSVAEQNALELVVCTGIAALVSVLGDLLESMFKRERGIKDSSQLLPGHGGILDRVDSITAAAPIFTLLFLLLQQAAK